MRHRGEKLALAPNPVPVDGAGRRGTNRTPPEAGVRHRGEELALAANPVPVDGAGRRGTNRTPPEAGVRSRDPVDCSNGTGGLPSLASRAGIAEIDQVA